MAQPVLAERIALIDMLVLDVDGVLTDGRIIYVDDGREIKSFDVRDGAGVRCWLEAGKRAAIISGRNSLAVARRAEELGIAHVHQGAADKLAVLRQLLGSTGLSPERVCAVGDDLADLPVLRNVGLGVAVADACGEVRAAAHHVTMARGGRGAVREVIELLLQGQRFWQPLLERLHAQRL
jgi:3-deoxy-D-manno-octulosonate 8-phosphate phosphatase (KDO 8-P phosphatase)